MSTKRGLFAVSLAAAAWIMLTSGLTASDELDRAKDLYRSAAYDEALTVLEALPTAAAAAEMREAREYRVFCLVALDRKDDAKKVIAELVTSDPMYAMSENEASPRVRTASRWTANWKARSQTIFGAFKGPMAAGPSCMTASST